MNNIEPSAVVNITLMLVVMAMLVNFLKTLGQEGLTMVDIWMFFCLFISTVTVIIQVRVEYVRYSGFKEITANIHAV